MNSVWIGWCLALIGVYGAVGVRFALPFVAWGVSRTDPQAKGGSWGFRCSVVPGTVVFWPWLARRWWTVAPSRGVQRPPEASTNRKGTVIR